MFEAQGLAGPDANSPYWTPAPTGCSCGQCLARTESGTGIVTTTATLPVWTNDQIAKYLTHDFWYGDWHRFDVAPGGTLTVNITALPSAAQFLAREALALWSDVTGILFSEVATGEQLLFTDTDTGAYASVEFTGNITASATINVSADWVARYGTTLNSYSFQTYLHEIGHALGLGHGGDYNGSADYATNAHYANDSWAASIMSYFTQGENSYTAALGLTTQLVVTPMIADALAATALYGPATAVRTGDTQYGFGNTSGRAVYDASQFRAVGYAIYDDGGIDTLDYSGFAANQRIDLNPEASSNVGGRVGNVTIARGVTIEHAIGGAGADTLIGNAAANRLTGNGGNDVLDGGAGADELIGGLGDDIYVIDTAGDLLIELAGEGGADEVRTTLTSFSLAALTHVEKLTSAGTGAFAGSGNEGDNVLTGGRGNDMLDGAGGSDRIVTGGGADVVLGGAGLDTLVLQAASDAYRFVRFEGSDFVIGRLEGARVDGVEQFAFAGGTLSLAQFDAAKRDFDPLLYAASHRDLALALGTDAAAAADHFRTTGFADLRDPFLFEPMRYVASNPDLIASLGTDASAAVIHYLESGARGGRATASFDALNYAASYQDLALVFGTWQAGAIEHFIIHGYGEGRDPGSFDRLTYIASHGDLIAAFGVDGSAGLNHYLVYGAREGRATASFDALLYGATYTDLVTAIGPDRSALTQHWLQYGFGESRSVGGFDPVAYLLSFSDLGDAALGLSGALRHWFEYGVREGRGGDALFGRDQSAHDLALGGTVADALGTGGERDWFQVKLAAGQTVTLALRSDLFDPSLALHDANGRQVAFDTDSGPGDDALISFTAVEAGLYYLVVTGTGPGAYTLDLPAGM